MTPERRTTERSASGSPSFSVVLFDLDDTLFRHSEAVASGVLAHRWAHSGALAGGDDATELARWRELEEHHYHRYLAGEVDVYEQRRARMRAFVQPFGIDLGDDRDVDEWFGRYLVEYRRAWALHDDALPALDELARVIPGVRFGIVTNAVLAFQTEKLDALELAARMEHVVASGEVGVAKPDPRIFEYACERVRHLSHGGDIRRGSTADGCPRRDFGGTHGRMAPTRADADAVRSGGGDGIRGSGDRYPRRVADSAQSVTQRAARSHSPGRRAGQRSKREPDSHAGIPGVQGRSLHSTATQEVRAPGSVRIRTGGDSPRPATVREDGDG